MEPSYALERMANIYDSYCDDQTLEWDDSSDMIEEMVGILAEAGFVSHCSVHGEWASFRDNCPACEWCSDCESSPCCCEEDETEEEDL
jgi:hypothetical protein